MDDAADQRQDEQQLDRHQAGERQRGQRHRLQQHTHLGDLEQQQRVRRAVGDGAGERSQEDHRCEIGGGDGTDPGVGVRQLPGEPRDADAL